MPGVKINKTYCKGCELCVRACPMQILEMSKEINLKGYLVAQLAEPTKCIGCRICAIVCPDVAIEVHTHGTGYALFEY
ncbi:MAG: 4Fe-4S dicluster domain-containing protein [FCB group bacterium]|nr:4Fe-4S dicluster domain-containing protein [FCB group bacterium]